MTEKQKIQLSNIDALSCGLLLVILVALFAVSLLIDPSHLFIVACGLLFILFFLIYLSKRVGRNEARIRLKIQNLKEHRNIFDAEINKEKTVINSFQNKIINYSQLKDLTEQLGMCLNLDETSKTISSEVNKLFGDKESTIILYLFHSKTGELGISSSHKGQLRVNLKSKKGDDFDQWIVKTMQPLLIEDTKSDYRFDVDKMNVDEVRNIRSLISVPLMVGNKALGILRIDSPKENRFTTEDLRLLTAIGDLGAVAVENAQLYERVEKLAIKDGLTGLYLRRFALDRLGEEVSRHSRRKKELSILMLDIDKFKDYNDKFGHIAGDIVLRTIGMLLSQTFDQPGNIICRYGGEEFLIALTECSKKQAMQLAEDFRLLVEKQDIMLRREKTHVTVSIGVSTFPKDAHNYKELIHYADMALYRAKNEGRNKTCAT